MMSGQDTKKTYRKRGYWENIDNVIKELEPLCEKYGRIPTSGELRKEGLSPLEFAISKHGGVGVIRTLMNQESARSHQKPLGYWKDIENVNAEMRKMQIILGGKTPSSNDLTENGLESLLNAMRDFHGGIQTVQKNLNMSLLQNERDYWKNWDNINEAFLPICKKLGRFPVLNEIREAGLNAALIGASKHFGKFDLIAEKMGFPTKRKTLGHHHYSYWDGDLSKVAPTLLSIKEKIGHYPSAIDLQLLNHKDLLSAINKKYGGFLKVYAEMGVDRTASMYRCNDGHYAQSSYELIFDNILYLNDIEHEHNVRIFNTSKRTDYIIKRNGIKDLYVEIWGLTSEEYKARKQEKITLYQDNNADLLSLDGANFRGAYFDIYNHIKFKLAEFNVIVADISEDEDPSTFISGTYDSLELLKEDLSDYIKDGVLPNVNEIISSKSSLYTRILSFGGTKKVCNLIGIKSKSDSLDHYPDRYFDDIENLYNELWPIYVECGYKVPTSAYMDKANSAVEHAIYKHFKSRASLEPIMLEYKKARSIE